MYQFEKPAKDSEVIVMKTNMGTIKMRLFPEKAPKTVENFVTHAKEGYYDGVSFHRVINGFMIQGGGLGVRMDEKPTHEPVVNEAGNGLSNKRGTLAMARTSEPHSAAAQFFINLVDNEELDHRDDTPEGYGYCVFGRVEDGMNVVDKIAKLKVKPQGEHEAVPVDMVVITRVSRFE